MKKHLLSFAAAMTLISAANAQSRFVLYEEFSGENCGPCASINPGLMALLNSGTNPDNIVIIKYQSPIPSAGPIYEENPTMVSNRMSYYSVPFAPYGRMDGAVSPGAPSADGAGNPYYLSQAGIDVQVAIASPFTLEIEDLNITATSVSANINVSAVTAGTYGNLKLRAALVETLDFETPPGSNGETHFTNVVREMYPNPTGQDAGNVWAAGESNSFTISGTTPTFVDINNEHYLVVWLQDDEGKVIHQTAKNVHAVEVESEKLELSTSGLLCGTPNTVIPTVTIKNKGTDELTSLTIYFKEESASSWESYSWTGSLASNASTSITLPSITSSSVGEIVIVDSIANPNGGSDKFLSNNVSKASQVVLKNTDGVFPIANDFESGLNGFVEYATADGYPMYRLVQNGAGYDGSNAMIFYYNYQLNSGVQGYNILPFADLSSAPKYLNFKVAYCQYNNENDKLEVVYSTDCGATWTSVWSKQGAELKTKEKQTGLFIPSNNSQWRDESVDLSSVPNGAQIAFRATSDYGNNLYVDNVNLSSSTGIENFVNANDFEVYPNPANDKINITLNANTKFDAQIVISDVSGKTVSTINKNVNVGSNEISLNISNLPSGTYFISMGNDEGSLLKKFVKK